MKALLEAMNVAYGETEKRGFVKLTLISLGFTLGAIVLLLALIGVMRVDAGGPRHALGWARWHGCGCNSAARSALALAALSALSALYRWGPSREKQVALDHAGRARRV